MDGFADMHSHFLYGLDDGAKTRKAMERMLDAAYTDGIRCLFATPHVTPGVEPYSTEKIHARVMEAKAYCRKKDYPIMIYDGAEILYTAAGERFVREGCLPTLANTNRILVEFVPSVSRLEMDAALELFERCGYEVIIAHVERYACLRNGRAYKLKTEFDVKYQMNCNTVVHGRGLLERICARKWLRDGLIDYVASDAHNLSTRPFRMRSAYAALEKLLDAKRAGILCGRENAYRSILEE